MIFSLPPRTNDKTLNFSVIISCQEEKISGSRRSADATHGCFRTPRFISPHPEPHHPLFHIFLRLPIKSLMRFRSASKQLLALIDDPVFAEDHIARSRISQHDSNIIINYDNTLVSLDFHLGEDNQSFTNARKLNCPAVTGPRERVFLLGCCNGIICLFDLITENLIFWNPSTGKFRKTEGSKIQWPYPECFTYDSVRDDYKVVQMSYASGFYFTQKEMEIYSVETGSWSKVSEGFPLGKCSNEKGVFVAGTVYWSWWNPSEESLLAFDLGSETFELIPLPDNFSGPCKLGALDQSLCLICNDFTSVYVMQDHGTADSWIHSIFLRTDAFVKCLISLSERNGQVIGTSGAGVMSFDDEAKKAEDIEILGLWGYAEIGQACVCLRSLVPL